jgi:hypothetical protein
MRFCQTLTIALSLESARLFLARVFTVAQIAGIEDSDYRIFNFLSFLHGWVYVPRWEPLFGNFVKLAHKLEELGFRYSHGEVTVVDIIGAKLCS